MRHVLALLLLVLVAAGCGTANDAADSLTSIPDTTALAVAEQNVRDASTALEAYFTEHGTYDGATADTLRQADPGLSPTVSVSAALGGYCIESVVRGVHANLRGPGGGVPQAGTC